jgi:hypothetical protein
MPGFKLSLCFSPNDVQVIPQQHFDQMNSSSPAPGQDLRQILVQLVIFRTRSAGKSG